MKILELNTITSVLVKTNDSYNNIFQRESGGAWTLCETGELIWNCEELEELYQKKLSEKSAKEAEKGGGKIVGTCSHCGAEDDNSLVFNNSELVCSYCNQ